MARRRAAGESLDALGPLDRPSPLRHRVQDALRELIIARTLPPGEHLVESALADRLDVSRGPVREALQALHSQGWVELRPSRGAFVHQPSAQEVDEVFAVRTALESEAAGLAAERVGPDDLAALREICGWGREAVAAGDEAAVVSANSALHRRIAELSGIGLLSEYVGTLDQRVRWHYRPIVRDRGPDSWDEHDLLLAALEAHDRDEAARVMRWHTERTRDAYRAMSAAEGDPAAEGHSAAESSTDFD